VVGLALALAALLVASTVAVVEFFHLQEARRELESAGGREAEEPDEDQGLGELFEDLLDDLLGQGGLPGGSQFDLFSCLSGEGSVGAQPVPPAGGGLEEQVRAIARAVEQIRQLRFEETVEPEFLSAQESAARVQELFREDYSAEAAETETQILEALGAVPRGIDLRETRAEALGSQVVGFYVPETGELVIRTAGDALGPIDRVTLAHELEHALADQNLDFPIPLEPKPGREDRDLAAVAVIEGDATLTMQRYAFTLPFEDQLELADPSLAAEAEAGLAELPYYLQQELLFPYENGLSFVCRLYAAGGWEAVNRAYAEPPTTSAQILFPDRFAAGEVAVDPANPDRLRGGWRFEGEHELGAANLLWLFEAPGGDRSRGLDDPMTGAGAWAGGEVHLWERGQDSAVGLALAEREDADVLCVAISHWYAAAFPEVRPSGSALNEGLELDGERQDAVLTCSDDEVHLGIGPDMSTARTLAGTT
jgi:hypothetical protein